MRNTVDGMGILSLESFGSLFFFFFFGLLKRTIIMWQASSDHKLRGLFWGPATMPRWLFYRLCLACVRLNRDYNWSWRVGWKGVSIEELEVGSNEGTVHIHSTSTSRVCCTWPSGRNEFGDSFTCYRHPLIIPPPSFISSNLLSFVTIIILL